MPTSTPGNRSPTATATSSRSPSAPPTPRTRPTDRPGPSPPLPISGYWFSLTYGNGLFVAVAYNSAAAAYSTDGVNWTGATLPSATTGARSLTAMASSWRSPTNSSASPRRPTGELDRREACPASATGTRLPTARDSSSRSRPTPTAPRWRRRSSPRPRPRSWLSSDDSVDTSTSRI